MSSTDRRCATRPGPEQPGDLDNDPLASEGLSQPSAPRPYRRPLTFRAHQPATSTKSTSNARNKDRPGGQNEPPEERGAAQGPSAFLFVEAEDTTADQKIKQHVMRDYLRKKRQRGVEFRHVRKGATGWETTGEASQASTPTRFSSGSTQMYAPFLDMPQGLKRIAALHCPAIVLEIS
jgi:hypothetical protein